MQSNNSIKKYLSKIAAYLIVGIFLFFGIKSLIHYAWGPPEQPKSYAIKGVDNREMSFTFFPDRRALVTYGDPNKNSLDVVLLKIGTGEYGTHYIGPIWNISPDNDGPFGLRWLSGGVEPVQFSYRVINKLHTGFGDSQFSPIGTEHETVWYFRPGGFYYSGMWLTEVEYNEEVVGPILKSLEKNSQKR
jgi:hypothetical protein